MIDQEKKRRLKAMEGKQADRNIKIINASQTASNLKKVLFDID